MSKSNNSPTQPKATQENTQLPMRYDVKIHALLPEGSVKANASVNLNGCFAVKGLKIIEGAKGLFISMPSFRNGQGEYKDICFPTTTEAHQELKDAVLAAYNQVLTQGMAQSQQADAPVSQEMSM